MRTISGGINGKLLITCTPLHGMTWLYDDLYDNSKAIPPYVEHCHVRIYDNPHLSKEAIDATLKDPAMADNIEAAIEGKFLAKSGLIYKAFTEDNIMEPITKVPENWLIVLGIDPHDRNPHGVVFMALTSENVWIVFDEILEQCILSELVAKIKDKLIKWGNRWPPNLAIIDTSAATPQSITGRSVAEELIQKYGLYISENCAQTLREIRHYVWDDWARYKDKQNPKERPLKKDDHLLDAMRYTVMANVVYRHPKLTYKPNQSVKPNSVTGYF
jgi:hypothetical protein